MAASLGVSPCLSCGACCAFFRATFHWMETAPHGGGTVPVELTEAFDFHRVAMRGTNQSHPRCVALMGIIGARVHCRIYAQRSSVCRAFPVAWENGEPSEGCDRARQAWGLTPLKPPWHHRPGHWPRAA